MKDIAALRTGGARRVLSEDGDWSTDIYPYGICSTSGVTRLLCWPAALMHNPKNSQKLFHGHIVKVLLTILSLKWFVYKLRGDYLLLLTLSHWRHWVLTQRSSIYNCFARTSFEFTDHGLFLTVAFDCSPTSKRLQSHLPRHWSLFVCGAKDKIALSHLQEFGWKP